MLKKFLFVVFISLLVAGQALSQQSSYVTGPHVTVETDGSNPDGAVNLQTNNFGDIKFYTNRTLRGYIDGSSGRLNDFTIEAPSIFGNLSLDGNLVYNRTLDILSNTVDADDDGQIIIAGGGNTSVSRGAILELYGNEGGGGAATIYGGNNTGGSITLQTTNATPAIEMRANSALRWSFNGTGQLVQDAGSGGDIVLNKATQIVASTGEVTLGSSGGSSGLTIRAGANTRWRFDQAGTLTQDATNGSSLIMAKDNTSILQGIAAIPADINAVISPRLLTFRASAGTSIAHMRGSADTSPPTVDLFKSRNTSGSADTIVSNGDNLGAFNFWGADGSSYVTGAGILASVDGAPGASDMPTSLDFRVAPDGSATPASALILRQDLRAQFTGTISSSRTSTIGWAVVDGTDNTMCESQCISAAVFGFNLAAGATAPVIVGASDATADICLCAGAS